MKPIVTTENNEVISQEPEILSVKNVMYYCHHLRDYLPKSKGGKGKKGWVKVKRYIEAGCIRYVGDMGEFKDKYSFICLPLNKKDSVFYEGVEFKKEPFDIDYNSRVYTLAKVDGVWTCNCQKYITAKRKGELPKDGVCCSHLYSLMGMFKMKKFGGGKLKWDE